MKIQTLVAMRILEIREGKKQTQLDVAIASGMCRTQFAHIENGRKNVSMDTLERIVVNGFDMTLKDFFNDRSFETGKIFNKR